MPKTVALGLLMLAFAAFSPFAAAQEAYPSRLISMVIPLSAGSQMDIIGRALADGMAKIAGQPVVVLNRDGAATTIGVEAVARARPDGYTIGFGPDGAFVAQPHLNATLAFRADDFEFICQTNATMFVFVVGPQSPYKTTADLIEAARRAPGSLNFGTAGVATSMHLLAESVAAEAAVKFNHVPFRNIGDLAVQTLSGTLDFTVTVPNMLNANSGKGMRALAISGEGKIPNLPPIPLLRDQGFRQPGPSGAIGMYAPNGIPPDALAWLRNACVRVVESPGFAASSARTLTAVHYADGVEYSRAIRQSSRVTGELLKKLDIKAQ